VAAVMSAITLHEHLTLMLVTYDWESLVGSCIKLACAHPVGMVLALGKQ
jgi:hypothetical protein